jgi:hypothetical protein
MTNKEERLYDEEVTSLCFDSKGTECSVACKNNVNIHSIPDIDHVKNSLIYRGSLAITHIAYDARDKHMYVLYKLVFEFEF